MSWRKSKDGGIDFVVDEHQEEIDDNYSISAHTSTNIYRFELPEPPRRGNFKKPKRRLI